MKVTISAQSFNRVRAESERRLSADEFAAIADSPISIEERAESLSRLRWYLRRYPTAGERLAYIRRATGRLTRPALLEGTAFLTEAFVAPGGVRATPDDGIRVCLMNVFRFTPTDLETRCGLLALTIRQIATAKPTILLAPAGYFGWDTVTGDGRAPLKAGSLDRDAALRFLTRELQLPRNLLLVVGVDWPGEQHIVFVEAGRFHDIRRNHRVLAERIYDFDAAGRSLRLLGLVCSEFQQELAPHSGPFQIEHVRRQHRVDVVLDPAHIEVKRSQCMNVDLHPFPFQRFFQRVSAAGAACFLAHHHPDEVWPGGLPKSHSYSNWGIFAGNGREEDWLPKSPATPVRFKTHPG